MTLVTRTYDDEAWQLVPRVPDGPMYDAALSYDGTGKGRFYLVQFYSEVYRAMLAVAPEPPLVEMDLEITERD